MGSSDNFRLRWNDFESNVLSSFRQHRADSEFLDVTLVTTDNGPRTLRAHKLVLSSCSNFFKQVLRQQSKSNPHPNPYIYLRGISYSDLVHVLDFMYHGEVKITQDNLKGFLALAEELQIKGLTNKKPIPTGNMQHKSQARASSSGEGGPPTKQARKSQGSSESMKPNSSKDGGKDNSPDVADVEVTNVSVKVDPDAVAMLLGESEDPENYREPDQQSDEEDYGLEDEEDHGYAKVKSPSDVKKLKSLNIKPAFDPMDYIEILPESDPSGAKCTLCGDKFKGLSGAKVHVYRTHGPAEYFQCNICSKIVKCTYNFRDHVMRNHGVRGRQIVQTYGKRVG